jgi:hypothetical protein
MTRIRQRLLGGVAVAWLALTNGCYKATFYQDPHATSGTSHEEWTHFFLFGLVGHEVVDVRRYCPPRDVAMVRTGANAGTGFVSIITLGIYTPRKVYVTCAAHVPSRATGAALSSVGSDDKEAQ